MLLTTTRPNNVSVRKHRIYWYSGHWYYLCGRCALSGAGKRWHIARDMLHLHTQLHDPS